MTAFLESINQQVNLVIDFHNFVLQKNMYKVKLPHFVIHDFDDEEESKVSKNMLFILLIFDFSNDLCFGGCSLRK